MHEDGEEVRLWIIWNISHLPYLGQPTGGITGLGRRRGNQERLANRFLGLKIRLNPTESSPVFFIKKESLVPITSLL